MAALVHRDFVEHLKSARIWGTGVHPGQSVGRDHVLHDKDVVELHL
jgi:ribosome-interacting GTPase 1